MNPHTLHFNKKWRMHEKRTHRDDVVVNQPYQERATWFEICFFNSVKVVIPVTGRCNCTNRLYHLRMKFPNSIMVTTLV